MKELFLLSILLHSEFGLEAVELIQSFVSITKVTRITLLSGRVQHMEYTAVAYQFD